MLPEAAQATVATGGYAWESILSKIMTSLTGPVAWALAVCCTAGFGLCLAASDGSMMRWGISILLGISIAASAASTVTTFFGFAGGATWA